MALLLFVALAVTDYGMCDQPRLRPLRHADETRLIFTATADTRTTGEGLPPFTYASWQPPDSRKPIAGQLVTLHQVSGADATAVATSGGSAVLVPWDHDTGCEPLPWSADARWIPVGQTGFVAARLRPRDRWVDGIPTFDVSDAWREPYSVERMQALTASLADAATAIMTPAEYASFYAALPELSQWQRNPLHAIRPLRAWRDQHPGLAAKYPARWAMETTVRWAERQGR